METLPLPVEEFTPPDVGIANIAKALNENLPKYFSKAAVTVVDCPDLSKPPYNLSNPGIGGYSEIVDLGGVPYLIPLPTKEKIYDLKEIIPNCIGKEKFPNGWTISGAAAGPWPAEGTNCEMVVNMHVGLDGGVVNKSKLAKTSNGNEMDLTVKDMDKETRCSLLANLLISSGAGKVLEIKAKGRLDAKTNFTNAIRESLKTSFGSTPVGLGGLFWVNYSKTKIHVMRDFSTVPLLSDEAVDEWLKFFQVDPPFLAQSVLVSTDPGLDLRVEHSHGWTTNGKALEAGHYHYDTLPGEVEYHALFTVAQKLVRIDRPKVTHNIGRD